METEILKFILSNRGSVNTEELVYNLCDTSSLSEIICKNDKFVSCLWNFQPRVVVRSTVGLCWGKDCPGCGRLHLCKNLLLSGSCHFQSRRGCTFSHDLHSDYNEEILREFGLETLTRTELCLLLLQSNNILLPSICHNYNNRSGCQDDCQRLHICERFLSRDCSCFRPHDFLAPQPLKRLQEKRIPDNLIKILKSVYANKEALRLADRTDHRGNRGNRSNNSDHSDALAASSSDLTYEYKTNNSSQDPMSTGDTLNTGYDTDSSSDTSTNQNKSGGHGVRRRGRRGGRSRRGNKQQDRTPSHDVLDFVESVDASLLFGNSKYKQNSLSADIKHTCPCSNIVTNVNESCERSLNMGKTGTSGGRENNPQTDGPLSNSDLLATFTVVDNTKVHEPNKSSKNPKPTGKSSNADAKSNKKQSRGPKGKTEICMFFIKGHCIHEDRCSKAHDKMPYRWEIKQDGQWTPMADNEKIEKDYCNPENTYSILKCLPVYFDIMRCGEDKVRRLSTVNSVLKPDYIHTTEWLWYWEDDHGKWCQYAAATSEHRLASITSIELEEMYLKNNKDVVAFTAGSQSYELSFQDMTQTNIKYGTIRLVRRRPLFVSAAEVQTKRKNPANSAAVPDYWDKTQISQTGHMCVSLQSSSGEYKEIQELFCQTMSGFDILKIERIQNKTVWEAFQLQKSHMKNKNGGRPVAEKKLFHGTDPKFINTICATNFDWRLCGVNGTAYGQGSYFACDASYSHHFTGDSNPRFMFVSRVLVGEYTEGRSGYKRPPSKDGGDVNLYDSCVDNVMSPSIFVVFEKQQIYPEYLLQYRERGNVYLNVFSQYGTTATRQTTYHQPAASTTTAPPVTASLSAISATTSVTKAQSTSATQYTSATKSQSTSATSATTSASRSQPTSATKSPFTSPTTATNSQFTFSTTPATTSATRSPFTFSTTLATTSATRSQYTSATPATTSATRSPFTFSTTLATTSATRSQYTSATPATTSATRSPFTFSTTLATTSATRSQSTSATKSQSTSATSATTSASRSQPTSATKSPFTSPTTATNSQFTFSTTPATTSATRSPFTFSTTLATTSATRSQYTSATPATTSATSSPFTFSTTLATTSATRSQYTSATPATTSATKSQYTSATPATTSATRSQFTFSTTPATTSATRSQLTSATKSQSTSATSATTSASRSPSTSPTKSQFTSQKSQFTFSTTPAAMSATSQLTSATSATTSATSSQFTFSTTPATTSATRSQYTSATSATTSSMKSPNAFSTSSSSPSSTTSQLTSATTSATTSQFTYTTSATKSSNAFSASFISGSPFRFAATTLPPTTSASRSTTASSSTAVKKQEKKTCVIA